jgi:hypothetical protein
MSMFPKKSHTIHVVLFIVVYEVERSKSFLAIVASSYCAPGNTFASGENQKPASRERAGTGGLRQCLEAEVDGSECECRRRGICQRGGIGALRQRPHRMKAAVAIRTMLSGNRSNSCRETW